MVLYNFKSIKAVPTANAFVDVVLSSTQRKTPTVIHPGYKIQRIRAFYMRKVKYTAEQFVERLGDILNDFPHLDSLHPFYADLCNVLYDRDHYKLALGQLNICKSLISGISRDYTRLLKYGDSLYRCKQLKRAAMGRMATLMKKQHASLAYLEEVRKHLARLPSIDPSTRTLLVTGFPNVGKSSFMNKVTNANVEVQPYAFTTKSIFVGHTDYKYLRWQVLDTPGILDKPLEERNTIEMQAITALAHLQCCVLYFIDLSETCGWSIEQQCSLFDNIRPLFANKPLIVIANKVDIMKWENLAKEKQELITKTVEQANAKLIQMSSLTEQGVFDVKKSACEMLLEKRVGAKMKSNKVSNVLHRITVTMPKKRDSKERGFHIPEGVIRAREEEEQAKASAKMEGDEDDDNEDEEEEEQELRPKKEISNPALKNPNRKKTFKDLEVENGGAGTFSFELNTHHILKDPSWIHDKMPEILDGKNIADFIDDDILRKLDDLEREEDEQMRDLQESRASGLEDDDAYDDLDEEEEELVGRIREKKSKVVSKHRLEKQKNRPTVPRSKIAADKSAVKEQLEEVGYDVDNMDVFDSDDDDGESRGRGRSLSRGRKRERSESVAASVRSISERSQGRSRSLVSRAPTIKEGEGLKNSVQKLKAIQMMRKKRKLVQAQGRGGESDRFIGNATPKHLNAGKRGMGKTDRR